MYTDIYCKRFSYAQGPEVGMIQQLYNLLVHFSAFFFFDL